MREEEDVERSQPRYDGDTYVTSHRRKTGVGNEPDVIDAREGATREREREDRDAEPPAGP